MIGDVLEQIGRGVAAVIRRPEWRVASLERRAFFWRREAVRLQKRMRETKGKKRKRLTARVDAAFARSTLLDERAQQLAERYGLTR